MMPMPISASASSAASTGPQDSRQGFFTGDFTAALGGSKASGSSNLLPLILVAAVVWLLMRPRRR